MPLNLQKARTDNSGQWVTISDPVSDAEAEVLIAPWENPAFRRLQMKLNQQYRRPAPGRRHIKNNNIPPEIVDEIQQRVVAETIVLDWRGLEMEDGVSFPYSKENALHLFQDDQLRWFFNEIVTAAMNEETFRKTIQEEDAENLSPASNGNSTTESMQSGMPN